MRTEEAGGIDVILAIALVLSAVAALVTLPAVRAMPAARVLSSLGALPTPAQVAGAEAVVMVDGP